MGRVPREDKPLFPLRGWRKRSARLPACPSISRWISTCLILRLPRHGTPEPGGVSFDELRRAATLVCRSANVVACDVNELSPPYDPSGNSTAAACKIVREMLLALLPEQA